jgi:hypothetical protein
VNLAREETQLDFPNSSKYFSAMTDWPFFARFLDIPIVSSSTKKKSRLLLQSNTCVPDLFIHKCTKHLDGNDFLVLGKSTKHGLGAKVHHIEFVHLTLVPDGSWSKRNLT